MEGRSRTQGVEALARACAQAGTVEELLAEALPVVRRLAGASAALVVQRAGEGQVVAARDGAVLDGGDLDAAAVAGSDGTLPVPRRWAERGVRRVVGRRLPGRAGTLFLAWEESAEESAEADRTLTEVVLASVEGGLGRLDAEERLTDLAARVDTAQQLAGMGDYDWHIESDTNTWSDQLYRIYGHEPQSFNASYERFLALIHPDDRDRISAIHQHSYATGEPYRMLERIVRPGGEVRYLASNGQVIHDEHGTPVRMRGTCIDITDRVLAEKERERSAMRFRNLVDSCPDAIVVVARDGRIVQANPRATELLGGDPVTRSMADLAGWPDVDGLGVAAVGIDGRELELDIVTAALSEVDDEGLVAAFVHDARPRLRSEAVAASLREVEVRRRQALEVNDNVVQGLSAAAYALDIGDGPAAASYLDRTLRAARRLMNEWLQPLGEGGAIGPGDLVRRTAATIDHDDEEPPVSVGTTTEPATTEEHAATEESASAESASGEPTTGEGRPGVLLVDDNDDMRFLLRVQLERSGAYDLLGEAADGETAVRLAEELQPRVVLLDLAMPTMDGLQALPLIRRAVPGVRVIVLSGFDETVMAEKAFAAGAVAYLEKGLRMDLDLAIREALAAPDLAPGQSA